ncbi:hypothetical protein ACQP00_19680 [Dactylosporangium sp. CS-047395]
MSDYTPAPPAKVSRASRLALTEDWAAAIAGLVLLALILASAVTTGLVP